MTPRNLIEELGRRLNIQLALDHNGLARIVVDGALPVDFELDEPNGRLLVYAVLGTMPVGPAQEVFMEEILAASLFGAELGPCSPAFDRQRNELLLWFVIGEDGNLDETTAKLEQLVGYAERWRTELSNAQSATGGAGADNGPEAATHGAFDGFVRA